MPNLLLKTLIAASPVVGLFNASAEEQVYHFSSISGLVEQEIGRIVLPHLYYKIGIDITITPVPAKRAQYELSSGISDGEILRIHSYGESSPDIIRVPTPYFALDTRAFVRTDTGIDIQSLQDLQDLHVAKVRGVKHSERAVAGVPRVTDLNSTEQILLFVSKGRADVALTNTPDGLVALKALGLDNVKVVGPPLQTLHLYHYIHKDHADLVPKIDQAIRDLQDSGELEDLIDMAKSVIYDY